MPFEGQGDGAVKKATQVPNQSTNTNKTATVNSGPKIGGAPERKQVSQPTGKLSTNNIGIKETLNPTIRDGAKKKELISSDQAEDFTFDQLKHVWKEYSLAIRREKRESMYSTLMNSNMTMSSDYQIHLEISNELQGKNLEIEKVELLGFVRSKLKNYSIGLKYSVIATEKMEILDSKGIFDKLAEENSSLNKFRKLFNLDIEF
ncbi:MAG: hypothetical protein GQ574_05590 [Crocinitomix sp.]|nr:hypothetical protein [Crocinitomix sp.]